MSRARRPRCRSAVWVPLLVGDAVARRDLPRRTSTERRPSVIRTSSCWSTIAASLSVALENARLFDETKRLLTETDERAAELAIINEVQRGSRRAAGHAGDVRGRRRQDPGDLRRPGRRHRHRGSGRRGRSTSPTRSSAASASPTSRWRSSVRAAMSIETRQALHLEANAYERIVEMGQSPVVVQGEPAKSIVLAPIMVGNEVHGVISLQNLDREHAFTESDVRLLTTLAASLSVSLENARLISRDPPACRRARHRQPGRPGHLVSSSICRRCSSSSASRSARRSRRTSHSSHCTIEPTQMITFPYLQRDTADGIRQEPIPLGSGLTSRILSSREPLLLNRARNSMQLQGEQIGTPALVMARRADRRRRRGHRRHQRPEHDQGGSIRADDVRLLATIAASVGTAIQNARLYRETQRRATEMAALADVGREISATLDPTAVLERIVEHAMQPAGGSIERRLPVRAGRAARSERSSRCGPIAEEIKRRHRSRSGEGIIGSVLEAARPRSSTTS